MKKKCPLCGEDNKCMAEAKEKKCWCETRQPLPESVGLNYDQTACFCEACYDKLLKGYLPKK